MQLSVKGLRKCLRGRSLLLLAATFALLGCKGSERTPAHPIADAYSRNSRKIELVALIIDDPVRARQVRSIYQQIATLAEELAEERLALTKSVTSSMNDSPLRDDVLKNQLLAIHNAGERAYERYTNLQLELRCHVTEQEFARLAQVH